MATNTSCLLLLAFLLCVPLVNGFSSRNAVNGRVFVSTPVSKLPKRFVKDCMQKITEQVVLTPGESVDEAMAALLSSGLSGAAVVAADDERRLVGMVSSFDFLQKEAFEGAVLPVQGSIENVEKYVEAARKIGGQKVEDIMTSENLMCVNPNSPMREAAAIMTKKGVHRLPVVDKDDNGVEILVGMLSTEAVMRDLLYIVQNLPAGEEEESGQE